MTFHHVLVAVDGSRHAGLALEAAISAAQRDHAKLTLLAVVPPVSAGALAAAPRLADEVEGEAQRTIDAAVEQVPDDVSVTTLVAHGKPGPKICEEASSGRYDGIFLGARGIGRAAGVLVGSVSQHVLRHTTVPAVVCHAP
jgi:nucleotide-binding universal stress UspA family protein